MAPWVWATEHPYLHTLIEISTPTMIMVIMFLASKMLVVAANWNRRK